jgi:hypothetical protein
VPTIAIDPLDARVVLIGVNSRAATTTTGDVMRSTNAGDSFVKVSSGLSGGQLNSLRFDASSVIAAATDAGVFVSSDLGNSWQNISANSVSNVFNDVVWDSNALYTATSGAGVLRAAVTITTNSALRDNRKP